ncbi:helix-turn-helix domain-containing protein [Spirosoma endbachense]|uniref:Helix-turn-helix domain-containing protein n=1 Tax=Spirosoma endbachense TaxID=2666025 RepID=A0A6P1W5W1_9BACT|nr:helix-turn-helix domain-containing protein [Spirosoma endbachense]QHW00295.1 helix-turn-helix domain-containing protein [Spirosoma endbachense]
MFIQFYPPKPLLASFIKGYQIVHVQTPTGVPLPTHPFPPHAVQNLSFYPRDPIEVFHYGTRQRATAPSCIIVGPQLSRVDLTMGRDLLIVATFFQPGGLHRLLGIPMSELLDQALDASLLWNAQIRQVDQQLRETTNYPQMQQIVEAFLIRRLQQKQVEMRPIDAIFRLLEDPTRPVSLQYLASQACLSPRQLERKFYERLGLGPKTFTRQVRFSQAIRLKEKQPDLDWLEVAVCCGYYDLAHMRRDFTEFAGSTPTLLLQEETQSLVRPYTSHNF